MKTFENENYYQILQVPANAPADDIKHAYREALALYEAESVATYSLFSEQQRDTLMQTIETAFETLIDTKKRAAYNQVLIDSGQVDAAEFSKPVHREQAAYSNTETTIREQNLGQWVQRQGDDPEIRHQIESIRSQDLLSGLALKQLREAYGIELAEIYAVTRISSDTLKKIEANQYDELPAEIYVKQFLKTYARILGIDVGHAVKSYLRQMAREKHGP